MLGGPPKTVPTPLRRAPIVKRSAVMKSYLHTILLSVALVFMMPVTTCADQALISIENIQNLSFGRFVAGNGGSVTVSTDGSRSADGIVLIPSSQVTAAQFTVRGDPNATYSIQLPGNDLVSLTGTGIDMFINNFISTPSGVGGQLEAGGSQALSVGGTLKVGRGQAAGGYSGSFSVTVDYN